jgi:hypothetical protein
MNPDILKKASDILSNMIEAKDSFEKIAVILKVIPIDCFDEAFRFFDTDDQQMILEALETEIRINSIETMMVVEEFIKLNDLGRFLKANTVGIEETLTAFQKYAGKNPRKISQMLVQTWLDKP